MIYNDHRGGYINNVPATFTRKNTDIGIAYADYPGGQRRTARTASRTARYCVPPGSPSINNNDLVGNAINPVTYQGIRVEALYKFNDDWNALHHAVLPGHALAGRVLPAAECLGRRAAAPLEVHAVQPRRTTRTSSRAPRGPSTASSAI